MRIFCCQVIWFEELLWQLFIGWGEGGFDLGDADGFVECAGGLWVCGFDGGRACASGGVEGSGGLRGGNAILGLVGPPGMGFESRGD